MSIAEIEGRRNDLSKELVNKAGSARYAVSAEEHRVDELLDERYTIPYAGEPRLIGLGRSLLAKAGLHHPEQPQVIERPDLEDRQQRQTEMIADELERSRELLRSSILEGVDDIAIDVHLGLRSDDCILPPFFQELHRRAEEETNNELTFLKWMTDHATNEQLINVWQWHDNYLNVLDSDPAFRERISTIKANYTEGSRHAITASELHPDIAVSEPIMDAIEVVHGSPFSPLLATAHAYADNETGVVQMQKGVSDFILYHEITHLLNNGLHFEFDEGATDLIAATIYNNSHLENDQINPSNSVYPEQIATLEIFERMTEGKVDLYALSHVYAGPSRSKNTAVLTQEVDEAIGIAITVPMLQASNRLMVEGMETYNGAMVRFVAQLLMRRQAEFLEAMMFDGQGNKIANTIQELIVRTLSEETTKEYPPDIIQSVLSVLCEAHRLQRLLSTD